MARSAPSVVAISARQVVMPAEPGVLARSHLDPGEEGADPFGPRVSTAMGSGFFVSDEGHIVTNNHVIANAAEIGVIRDDGSRHRAEIVGTDPLTDLAVLKLEEDGAVPAVPAAWGDSEALQPGAWTIAVGSPFGLGGTVTIGVLSARQRDISEGPYDEFLQTDAAINVGNSGGPLFNAAGQVVGVNTAIFSPTGASVGIGFAVPSRMAERVVAELIETGQVRRGFLGAGLQDFDPVLARAFGHEEIRGALVSNVEARSPAERAGLKQGDVVVRFGESEIASARDLSLAVAESEAARADAIAPGRPFAGRSSPARPVAQAASRCRATGTRARPVRGHRAAGPSGGLAAVGGIRRGDLILEAGQAPVGAPEDVSAAWDAARSEARPLLLQIRRGTSSLFLAIEG